MLTLPTIINFGSPEAAGMEAGGSFPPSQSQQLGGTFSGNPFHNTAGSLANRDAFAGPVSTFSHASEVAGG